MALYHSTFRRFEAPSSIDDSGGSIPPSQLQHAMDLLPTIASRHTYGDWREEIIMRSSDNKQLVIFNTTVETEHKLYTLMSDPVYRCAVAWQNSGYNQPPHVGYYLGEGMDTPTKPDITILGNDNTTGLDNMGVNSVVVCYPTIVEDVVNVKIDHAVDANASITVIDIAGSVYAHTELVIDSRNQIEKLSLSGISSGMYLVKITIGEKLITQKIIKN